MNINFHPRRGTVLWCDFEGYIEPEIIKKRPVVVLSSGHRDLCTVVPLSTTEPIPMEACHHLMEKASLPTRMAGKPAWAKCDCISTVCFARLDRVNVGRDGNGKRVYEAKIISDNDLQAIERCLIRVLRMTHLTK